MIDPKQNRRRKLKPPLWVGKSKNLPLGAQGSLEGWKATVASLAACSAPAMLSIAASFAAPLLKVTGRQPFGINLFGPSKIGKSTAALAGASVIGIGRETDLPNWAATPAARGEHARIFNDMLMPINEVGLLAGSKKAAYNEIRTAIYNICEGSERRRHSASTYAAPEGIREFRTIFLSTSETSFDEYARLSGEKRDDGEYARCLDVPASARRKTIVSNFPKGISRPDRERWARKKVVELRRACEKQHGTAFAPYVGYLIARRESLASLVGGYSDQFLHSVQSRQVEGALEHAAENFALVYAGGCVAIDSGIVPWSKQRLLRAITRCFAQGLDELARVENVTSRACKKFQLGLRKAKIAKRKATGPFSKAEWDGYVEIIEGKRIYTIHARRFRAWFGGEDEMRTALNWLHEKGCLRPRKARTASARGGGSAWAEQTPKWPDGKSVRSIVFSDPFPSSSAPKHIVQ